MSRWERCRSECGPIFFHFACFFCCRAGCAGANRRSNAASTHFRDLVLRITKPAALSLLALACCCPEISRAQQSGFGIYARAVEYCRGNVGRPFSLESEGRVLCFDGEMPDQQDISLAKSLAEKGLFVVRSYGGNAASAIALANLLRDRQATVVVYDYCLSACASYLLLATAEAFVMKDALVAWHFARDPLWCVSLEVPKDGGPKRLEQVPCPDAPSEYQGGYGTFRRLSEQFYETRVVDPQFEGPPQSFTIRKILRSMFEGAGTHPDVFWTWNPRYYASTLKGRITFEEYPKSQTELDEIRTKLHLAYPVIYDP